MTECHGVQVSIPHACVFPKTHVLLSLFFSLFLCVSSSEDADKDSDDDDDNGLFDDSDDEATPAKKTLSKRERMEALTKKKRSEQQQQQQQQQPKRSGSKGSSNTNKNGSAEANKNSGYDSEDSYNSAEYVRTQEDNDFIDTEGDDADAVAELYAEQHFDDDERGEAMEERKKKKSIKGAGSDRGRSERSEFAGRQKNGSKETCPKKVFGIGR